MTPLEIGLEQLLWLPCVEMWTVFDLQSLKQLHDCTLGPKGGGRNCPARACRAGPWQKLGVSVCGVGAHGLYAVRAACACGVYCVVCIAHGVYLCLMCVVWYVVCSVYCV